MPESLFKRIERLSMVQIAILHEINNRQQYECISGKNFSEIEQELVDLLNSLKGGCRSTFVRVFSHANPESSRSNITQATVDSFFTRAVFGQKNAPQ